MGILLPKPFRNTVEVSTRYFAAAKVNLAHECHFAASVFPNYTGHHLSCEKGFKNQSTILAASSSSSHKPRRPCLRSSSPFSKPPKIDSPKWHEHEGQSLHPLRTTKRRCERSQFQNLLQRLRRQGQSTSGEARAAKAAGKTISYQHRFQSRSLANSHQLQLQFHRRYHSGTPRKIRSLKRRFPSPKFKQNSSGRTFRVRPELAQSFQLLRRYHMEQLAPRDFFYPRIVTDFYQSMTTKEVRNPTLIHFIIDGRHGILGARHIAEALQIPFEPTQFDNFKAWANPTELRDRSHPFQRSCKSITFAEGGASPVMFLIDAFLRHNIYPLQHWTQRRGVLLEALYKMSEGFFFGPHHLIMAALLYFEEKVHKKKLQEQIAFPSSSQGCYANLGSLSQLQGEPPQDIPEDNTCLLPSLELHQLHLLHHSHPHQLSRGWPSYIRISRAVPCIGDSYSFQSNLAQELAAIKACQEQMLASQAQQAAILRQLQVHFDLPQAVEPSISTPPEPHSQPSESHPPEPEAPADPPTEEADPSA
ncbi:hypothetical protein CK203_046511 [Vitis vinifera]|uniref:Uncharacterized protein n=1 Tax=Vitis vinifera TaxID=29760 RepID=A0A438ILG3_VITVI|nr:hypothetical protein CK203_046511 [Vitis vinifera]